MFDEGGVNPASIKTADDLAALPILDKQTVRDNVELLKPKSLEQIPHITEHTSGSTGSSLIFPQSVDNVRDLWAAFWRFWNRIGIEYGTRYADFGSRTIVPPNQRKPPFWRECQPLFQIKFSALAVTALIGLSKVRPFCATNDANGMMHEGYPWIQVSP